VSQAAFYGIQFCAQWKPSPPSNKIPKYEVNSSLHNFNSD